MFEDCGTTQTSIAEPKSTAGSRARPWWALTRYPLAFLLIAIPCVWQTHIEADDLSSHLYNAWLVSEVSAGHLPGLYVVPQFTNVLFDHLLSLLMKTGNLAITEHVAVLVAVQIFFWGCFTLASTFAGKPAFSVAPFLGIVTYGAVFRMGFFNFYLSVGICAWAIALVWQDRFWLRLLALPLLVLAYTAHSIPCVWAIAIIAYLLVARRLRPSQRPWLVAIGLLSLAGMALFLARNVPLRWVPGIRIDSILGTDQVLTFGMKYKLLEVGLLCLWIFLLVRRFEMPPALLYEIPFHLLVLSVAACLFMPNAIWLPIYSAGLTYISIRLSLFSAILFCAVVAPVRIRSVEKLASGTLLVLFFSFTYVDERAINSAETNMARAVATLPPGSRVVATLRDSRLFLPALEHLVDRVCIGRCYHFADYEPATTQFRLRAKPGNSYVMTDINDVLALENDGYVWRRQDIELYRLLPCQESHNICASVVAPGERLVKQQFVSAPKWWRLAEQ